MIVSSIDIGTNTVLLLIAEVNPKTSTLTPLRNEYRMPRIGQDTKKTGVISVAKIELLLKILGEYKEIIQSYSCDLVLVTGTNAFRLASNSKQIVETIKQKFNFDLNIISGEEEAEYAFLGAISGLNLHAASIVIDVGGSSTEIIFGENDKIISKSSLQLGSVSATEEFLLHSPPFETEIEELNNEIHTQLSTIQIDKIPSQVITVAGTATTLACMIKGLKEFDGNKIDNIEISKKEIGNIITDIKYLSSLNILGKYGPVVNGREDIIFAGICIIYRIMEFFKISRIKVSTRGIRFGAILKYLQGTTT